MSNDFQASSTRKLSDTERVVISSRIRGSISALRLLHPKILLWTGAKRPPSRAGGSITKSIAFSIAILGRERFNMGWWPSSGGLDTVFPTSPSHSSEGVSTLGPLDRLGSSLFITWQIGTHLRDQFAWHCQRFIREVTASYERPLFVRLLALTIGLLRSWFCYPFRSHNSRRIVENGGRKNWLLFIFFFFPFQNEAGGMSAQSQ